MTNLSNMNTLPTAAPEIGQIADLFLARLDSENTFRLPSVCADAGALGPCWLAAASMSGLSHLHDGRTGQDSYSFARAHDGGAISLAVADGLGSRPFSAQIGAVLLARMICAQLSSLPTNTILSAPQSTITKAIVSANNKLRSFYKTLWSNFEDHDLASTVAFLWAPIDYKTYRALAGRVGDCAIFTLHNNEYNMVFDCSEGPQNVVDACLPTIESLDSLELRYVDLSAGITLILATDGLAEDVCNSPAVRDWLARCWSSPCDLFQMLEALRYRRQGSHDDRTALVVWLT